MVNFSLRILILVSALAMKDEFSGLALREGGFMTFSLPGSSGEANKTTIEIHNSFNKGNPTPSKI